jgi:hypothetical protein
MRRPNINYPYRNEAQTAALARLPATAYAEVDQPFLFTQRYSLSPDFEYSDVAAKQQVDLQGALDNQYWLHVWESRKGE